MRFRCSQLPLPFPLVVSSHPLNAYTTLWTSCIQRRAFATNFRKHQRFSDCERRIVTSHRLSIQSPISSTFIFQAFHRVFSPTMVLSSNTLVFESLPADNVTTTAPSIASIDAVPTPKKKKQITVTRDITVLNPEITTEMTAVPRTIVFPTPSTPIRYTISPN